MKIKYLVWIFVFSLWSISTKAQLNADFTATITEGCSPIIVQFTDLSTGGATSWSWQFGNGNSSSNQNPQDIYGAPGNYTVTLIISDGTSTDTITKSNFITVHPNPQPGFVSLSGYTGCTPFEVSFLDASTAPSGIVSWLWDFGDGDTSTVINPQHTYEQGGVYSITLTIANTFGCDSTVTFHDTIETVQTPVASFLTDSVQKCAPPFTIIPQNLSSGSGNLNYLWDFGDGSNSTLFSPLHNYITYGSFNISLVVSTDNNCSDTMIMESVVNILTTQASFTTSGSTFCKAKDITFTNTSVGASTFLWNFGDGNTSSEVNPIHSYSSSGSYLVTLTATVAGDTCTDTYTGTITIENVIADFVAGPRYGCSLPHTVTYTDLSSNAAAWEWNFFHNNNLSSAQNPTVSYNITNQTGDSLRLYKRDHFNTQLIVTSAYGCKDTAFKEAYIFVSIPDPQFSVSETGGCEPLDVTFSNISTYNSNQDAIQSISWNLGDGNTATDNTVTNTYYSGAYNVILNITTNLGCDTSRTALIRVGTPPIADYIQSDTIVCASDSVYFTDLSEPSTMVNSWQWAFSDGNYKTLPFSGVLFRDTGYIDLTYIVGYNGCNDTIVADSAVYVHGPIVAGKFLNDCSDPMNPTIDTMWMLGADRWHWDFGDGTTDTNSIVPIQHEYAESLNYYPVITAFNDQAGCEYSDTFLIRVRDIKSDFLRSDSLICRYSSVSFDATPSDNEITNLYIWNWDEGTPSDTSIIPTTSHFFSGRGIHNVSLVTTDVNFCKDTAHYKVITYQPETGFTSDATAGCSPLLVNFIDTTVSDTTIESWHWQIDNTIIYNTQNISHVFTEEGGHRILLTTWDVLGCNQTIAFNDYITVSQPLISFTSPDTLVCLGDSVHFLSQGDYNYLWDFGDGNTSTSHNPTHYYSDTGFYSISLLASDTLACDSSITRLAYVHVQNYPEAKFTSDTTYTDCYPLLAHFYDTTGHPYINSWKWSFGDGSSSFFPNPLHNYNEPGLFDVSLIVQTTAGCSDTITKTNYIELHGPFAEAKVSPDSICLGDTVLYIVNNYSNIADVIWAFGDGDTLATNVDTVYHVLNVAGWLIPRIAYNDSSGQCSKYAEDSIYVHNVFSDFITSDSAYCVGYSVPFSNMSTEADTYFWDFGNGFTDSLENPFYTYPFSGSFDVTLISNYYLGCVDTVIKNIDILDPPPISISNDTTICFGDTIQIQASGSDTYLWTPGNNISNSFIPDPLVFPSSETVYWVEYFHDNYTCYQSDSIRIGIFSLPQIEMPQDTTICTGDSIQISLPPGFDAYIWSTGDSLQSIFSAEKDTITAQVQDNNGCFSPADTMIVDLFPLPVIQLGNDTTICNGDTLVYFAGSDYTSYYWHNGFTTASVSISNRDTIFVSVIDTNTCAGNSDTTHLQIFEQQSVNLPQDTTICTGDSLKLNAGSNFTAFQWSTGATSQFIMVNSANAYYVSAQDTNTCSVTPDTILISLFPRPYIELGNDTSICFNDPITFTVDSTFDTYNWFNGNTTHENSLVGTNSNYIMISVRDGNHCWSLKDSLYLTIDTLPSVFLGNDTILCRGDSLVINAGSGYQNYWWSSSDTTQTITAGDEITASAKVQNSFGCWSDPDTIIIGIHELPVIDLGPDSGVCFGDTVLLSLDTIYSTYLWSDGQNNNQYQLIADSTGYLTASVTDTNGCNSLTDTIHIVVNSLPYVFLGNDTSICFGDTLSLNAGNGFTNYAWSNGQELQEIFITTADTIFVHVTDSNGCNNLPDTLVLMINPLPAIFLGNDTTICRGESVILNPGSGYVDYAWSDGSTLDTIEISEEDTIILSVKDTNQCQSIEDTITVSIFELPVAFINQIDTAICSGDSMLITAPVGFNTYLWSTGDTTQTVMIKPAMTIDITMVVTDTNNCYSIEDSMLLQVYNLPQTNLADSILICPWDTLMLDPGEGFTYNWSTGDTAQVVFVNFEDTLILRVTDTNLCQSIPDTSIITFDSIPEIYLGNDTVLCRGESLTIAIDSNYSTYLWHNASSDNFVIVNDVDTVWAIIQTTAMCKTYTDTIIVSINELPVIELGNDTILCEGEGYNLSAPGFVEYLWSDGDSTDVYILYPAIPGYVWLSAKDSNNCWSEPDSLFYDVIPAPHFEITDSIRKCPGDTVLLDAGPGYVSYQWSTGDTTQTIMVINPGEIIAEISDGTCPNWDTVKISQVDLAVDLGDDTYLCDGESMVLDAYNNQATYSWSTGDTSAAITIYPWVRQYVVLVNKEFCAVTDSIFIDKCPAWPNNVAELPNAFSPNNDGNNDRLRLLGYNMRSAELMIFDRYGIMVYQTDNLDDAINRGWDGKYNSVVQETEVYIYYLKVKFIDGEYRETTGNVTLIN